MHTSGCAGCEYETLRIRARFGSSIVSWLGGKKEGKKKKIDGEG